MIKTNKIAKLKYKANLIFFLIIIILVLIFTSLFINFKLKEIDISENLGRNNFLDERLEYIEQRKELFFFETDNELIIDERKRGCFFLKITNIGNKNLSIESSIVNKSTEPLAIEVKDLENNEQDNNFEFFTLGYEIKPADDEISDFCISTTANSGIYYIKLILKELNGTNDIILKKTIVVE